MGRDPPPVLPGRLAAEEAPAEEAAEVWVRWAVLRLALLLMVLPLLLPRRRRPWVLRLWQRVLWRLLLGLLLGLLLWLLQAVVRRPKEDRGNKKKPWLEIGRPSLLDFSRLTAQQVRGRAWGDGGPGGALSEGACRRARGAGSRGRLQAGHRIRLTKDAM